MKLIIDPELDKKGFNPFEMTLRFETDGEARLMWHVFNRLNLWDAINKNNYGIRYITPVDDFTDESINDSCSIDVKDFIARHVTIDKE